jgi:zinc transport system substrate-binding protein
VRKLSGRRIFAIALLALLCFSAACSNGSKDSNTRTARSVVASDTILSSMAAALLPPDRYSVEAILPPGQCPGHYDVKPSDIEKMQKADLMLSFKGMPCMEKSAPDGAQRLVVDAEGRNLMTPEAYLHTQGVLAEQLAARYPDDKEKIARRSSEAAAQVTAEAALLKEKITRAGMAGACVLASSMQKEPLEWMGLHVAGEYGRPEALSAREVVRLSKIGRERRAVLVVDNLQSGPDAGKGIAEALGVPHVVLSNFPSERGYVATLKENVEAVLAAVHK